jgi:transposase
LRYIAGIERADGMAKANWKIEGTMASAQRAAIVAALHASSFRVSEAARILGVGRTTIYRLIRVYEIPIPQAVVDDVRSSPELVARSDARSTRAKAEELKVTLKDGAYYLSKTPADPDHRA